MSCRQTVATGCLLALVLAACSVPAPAPASPWAEPAGGAEIYVVQRGWHTDIGLPVESIEAPLSGLERDFPGVRFLTFGFGERQFLVTRKRSFGAMLRALLPSQSAVLVTALQATPEAAFGTRNVVRLLVSQAALVRIKTGLWRTFEVSGGAAIRLAAGPYPGSAFYAGRTTYDLFFTCNTWTAGILRDGGLAVPATGVVLSDQVMAWQITALANHGVGHSARRTDDGGMVRRWRRITAAE